MKIVTGLFAAAVTLAAASAASATVTWTQWTDNAPGDLSYMGTVDGVGVTYTGEHLGVIHPGGGSFAGYIPNSSFIGGPVDVVPTDANGAIQLVGGNDTVDTITFSTALIDPVFLIWSLGQNNDPTTFNFIGNPDISIVAGGPTTQYGGMTITDVGPVITGVEGNGVIQFHGAITSISWTNPSPEFYYAFTVGSVGVPEPAAWALMIGGFGMAGAALRRRRSQAAAA